MDIKQYLDQLKKSVRELGPEEAQLMQLSGAKLIDIRDQDEIAGGVPTNAILINRSFLEFKISEVAPDKNDSIMIMCAGGSRSLIAADSINKLGYVNVFSIRGGMEAWKQADLPLQIPKLLDSSKIERYSRHLKIPEVGNAGQIKLLESKVLLIGAGGLGSPSAFYLAAAGVGTIGIVDSDIVDKSNLQRQILHKESTVGKLKVESARQTLTDLNSDIDVKLYPFRLDASNIDELVAEYDIVVDGSDNFPTRYLVNDACTKWNKPNVHASVYRFEGQVTVFCGSEKAPCYRCLYPEPPPAEMAPSCAEAGVLGVLPGVMGLLQAVETIKLIVDMGSPLIGRMLSYDALAGDFCELEIIKDSQCQCSLESKNEINYATYDEVCGI